VRINVGLYETLFPYVIHKVQVQPAYVQMCYVLVLNVSIKIAGLPSFRTADHISSLFFRVANSSGQFMPSSYFTL
jgi:hypothetical protein